MIQFSNISQEKPFFLFKEKYDEAFNAGQKNIEAIAVSSYDIKKKEVDSRYVNLKFVTNNKFIFFSNYNSPKASAFSFHDQVAMLVYWSSINVQIRIKAKIKQTTDEYNQKYFYKRSEEKNALAISSNQSKPINSYNQVKKNYDTALKNHDLKKCPKHWGGFSLIPYYFEFWEGHESRINRREVFNMIDGYWEHSFLQP